ncbi:MAG TPA: nucleotide exchange factor GrpE, partial [Caldisericia bacterium]|nr:nucleotide exchange factor GrpE [Caldisericia bacterium]
MENREEFSNVLFKLLKEKQEEIKKLKEEVKALSLLIKKERRDLEHFQKRWKEEEEERKTKQRGEIISSLLHIIDSLNDAKSKTNDENLIQGLELIEKQFIDFLKEEGVEEVGTVGEEFNPSLHQAINIEPTNNGEDDGKIIEVYRKGYKIKDFLIRP